jgi:uncharacterized protein (TIGR03067 family)
MKLRLLTILTILAVGLTLGADLPKNDKAAKDLDRFQGTWVLVSSEANGVKADAEELKKAEITLAFEGEKFTVKLSNGKTVGTFKPDPAKKPRAFATTATDPAGKTSEGIGIYKFDGDTLTFCFVVGAGKGRPTEFEAGAGSEAVLQVFRRDKK